MPAEFEPHAATWLAWPHNPETWPDCLGAAEREFSELVAALLTSEPVHVLAQSEAHRDHVAKQIRGVAEIHIVPSDDSWLRDIGPTFVRDAEELVALDWTFNSWGGKYPPWEADDAVASAVAALAGTRCLRSELVLEGGSLEVDGRGTLLATRSSLLDPKRNAALTHVELERSLASLLGVQHVIWLEAELAGDDTDSHIDNIARFVAPGRVVYARETNESDANYEALTTMKRALEAARDAHGRALELVPLPMPPALEADGSRLPASYANFYIANRVVCVPAFQAPSDRQALSILTALFPGREVVAVPARALVRGLGTLHCLTQQQPR
jgi:agmatine deiminase